MHPTGCKILGVTGLGRCREICSGKAYTPAQRGATSMNQDGMRKEGQLSFRSSNCCDKVASSSAALLAVQQFNTNPWWTTLAAQALSTESWMARTCEGVREWRMASDQLEECR